MFIRPLTYLGIVTAISISNLVIVIKYQYTDNLDFFQVYNLIFPFVAFYFLIALIYEIKAACFKSPNRGNIVYEFFKSQYFKHVFCLQGYCSFKWLWAFQTSVLKEFFIGLNDLPEFLLIFFNFFFMVMAIFWERRRGLDDNFRKHFTSFLVITFILYLITTVLGIVLMGGLGYEFILTNLVEFVFVILIGFNSWQLYKYLVGWKNSKVEQEDEPEPVPQILYDNNQLQEENELS